MPKGIRRSQHDPKRYQVDRLSQRHRDILHWLKTNPYRTLRECALETGHTQAWIYMLVNTDLFQEELAKHNTEMHETFVLPLHAKLLGTAELAVDRLAEKIEVSTDPDFLLAAADKTLHRLGYAPSRGPQAANVQVVAGESSSVFVVDNATLASARERLEQLRAETPTIEGEAPALPAPE